QHAAGLEPVHLIFENANRPYVFDFEHVLRARPGHTFVEHALDGGLHRKNTYLTRAVIIKATRIRPI
ncbi:hypothetical protein, partial [Salmonella enterica]|uniref:hypothetical protein n=1 Tax=Salmonella enterica TaxID=28901 RepID=UPI003CF468AB